MKPEPVHKRDDFLRGKGHDVLHLPPYHCEFNPIEMVWGDVKGYVGWEYKLSKFIIIFGISFIMWSDFQYYGSILFST
jgi:transposase